MKSAISSSNFTESVDSNEIEIETKNKNMEIKKQNKTENSLILSPGSSSINKVNQKFNYEEDKTSNNKFRIYKKTKNMMHNNSNNKNSDYSTKSLIN